MPGAAGPGRRPPRRTVDRRQRRRVRYDSGRACAGSPWHARGLVSTSSIKPRAVPFVFRRICRYQSQVRGRPGRGCCFSRGRRLRPGTSSRRAVCVRVRSRSVVSRDALRSMVVGVCERPTGRFPGRNPGIFRGIATWRPSKWTKRHGTLPFSSQRAVGAGSAAGSRPSPTALGGESAAAEAARPRDAALANGAPVACLTPPIPAGTPRTATGSRCARRWICWSGRAPATTPPGRSSSGAASAGCGGSPSAGCPAQCRGMNDTEDLVQETVIRALNHLDRFEFRHEGALLAYLRQSLLNRIVDEVRKTSRRPAPGDARRRPGGCAARRRSRPRLAGRTSSATRPRSRRLRPRDREAIVLRLEQQADYARSRAAARDAVAQRRARRGEARAVSARAPDVPGRPPAAATRLTPFEKGVSCSQSARRSVTSSNRSRMVLAMSTGMRSKPSSPTKTTGGWSGSCASWRASPRSTAASATSATSSSSTGGRLPAGPIDEPNGAASKVIGRIEPRGTLPLDDRGRAGPATARAPERAPRRAQSWGPLELHEKVGEGTFGEVYRARDTQLHREVAVKLLRVGELAGDRLVDRMLREGRVLARVEHPERRHRPRRRGARRPRRPVDGVHPRRHARASC